MQKQCFWSPGHSTQYDHCVQQVFSDRKLYFSILSEYSVWLSSPAVGCHYWRGHFSWHFHVRVRGAKPMPSKPACKLTGFWWEGVNTDPRHWVLLFVHAFVLSFSSGKMIPPRHSCHHHLRQFCILFLALEQWNMTDAVKLCRPIVDFALSELFKSLNIFISSFI